jgi:transposase
VGRKSLTEEEKRLIIEKRKQGFSIEHIAKLFNHSKPTVRKLLKKYGLAGQLAKPGRPNKRNEPIPEEVAKKMSEIITEAASEVASEHFEKEKPKEQEIYSELLVERRPISVKLLKKLEDLGYLDIEQALLEFIELKEGKVGEIEKELIHWRTKAFDFHRKLEEKQRLINKVLEDLKELFENYNDDIGVI